MKRKTRTNKKTLKLITKKELDIVNKRDLMVYGKEAYIDLKACVFTGFLGFLLLITIIMFI